MKKILLFLLACITVNIQCMEQPAPTDIELESGSFAHWPDELIMHLLSFIPEATSMKEIFIMLAQLSIVNRKFQRIAEDTVLLNQLAKRYCEFHPQEAEKEFRDAIDHILKDQRAQDYKKIIAALASTINTNLKNQALLDAADAENNDLLIFLINCGDINAVNSIGATALFKACSGGNEDLVKLLIHHGANVHIGTNRGSTPLMWASAMGHEKIVKLLLDNGADIYAVSRNGSTALTFASKMKEEKIAKLLKDYANAFKWTY